MILKYSGSSPVQTVRQWVQNGRLGVTPSLLTSATMPSGTPALGMVDNSLLHLPSFAGQSLGGVFSQVLVKSTVAGDTNLDGVANQLDYVNVLANMGMTGAQWFLGDLNGDGMVTPDDLAVVTANVGTGTGNSSSQLLVNGHSEPATSLSPATARVAAKAPSKPTKPVKSPAVRRPAPSKSQPTRRTVAPPPKKSTQVV
jgi:hypothetical protein